jgi:hypothetical protein
MQGALKKANQMKATCVWQKAIQIGIDTHVPQCCYLFPRLCYRVFGVFPQGAFKNTTNIFLGEVHVENLIYNLQKNLDSRFYYRVFGRFSSKLALDIAHCNSKSAS